MTLATRSQDSPPSRRTAGPSSLADRWGLPTIFGLLALITVAALTLFLPGGPLGPRGRPSQPTPDSLGKTMPPHEPLVFSGHSGLVFCVGFSPDGKRLASASSDNTVRVWDIARRSQIAALKAHTDSVYTAVFSPDGSVLVSGSWDRSVIVWDTQTWKPKKTFAGDSPTEVTCGAISPDGRLLAVGRADGPSERGYNAVTLYDLVALRQSTKLTGHDRGVRGVAFSPDGKLLASVSADHTGRIWDWRTEKTVAILRGHENYVRCVAFSPDGKLVATGGADDTVRLWDVGTGEQVRNLGKHTTTVNGVAFSPDGQYLFVAVGESAEGPDGELVIWDLKAGRIRQRFEAHKGAVESLALSPDGKALATGGADGKVHLWEVEKLLKP